MIQNQHKSNSSARGHQREATGGVHVCQAPIGHRAERRFKAWRIFWGVLFLGAAATVILSMFNIVTFGINIGWILFTLFLIALGIASLFKLNWFGFFMAAAGVITISVTQTPDVLQMSPDMIGPVWITAWLLSIGLTILFHSGHHRALSRVHGAHRARHDQHTHFDRHHPDEYESVINSQDNSEVYVDVNMGSTIKYVNTDDLQRAVLNCKLGSIKAYFDNASIIGDTAVIEVYGTLSGFELYVPNTWNVVDNVSNSMSGVSEKNPRKVGDPSTEKTVTLSGSLTMSGVEIIYV
jgi:hypothetical protein